MQLATWVQGIEIAVWNELEAQGVSVISLTGRDGMEYNMALAVTEAEPKEMLSLTPYFLDSETSSSQPTTDRAQELDQNTTRPQSAPSALVVEDDSDISLALQDLLEFEGFQVDCAITCRQAFASIAEKTYDVVLLDLGLPDGDGTSILEDLHVSHPTLPVIVLTASNRDLGSLPAFARITKPWVRRDLCSVLHRAVETPSMPIST